MDKKLPISCPSCSAGLKVKSLYCENCETTITGQFELPVLLRLEPREQNFILDFIQCSGSLKLMASKLNLSYPTVRNMLDDLIGKIKNLQHHD
ncbi:DUF2089 family protein [Plebeiibacterium marinum]|uniref:DUF2089 domain-containing protein n=1 Tax=Plebeiibacterium marinum TaxID=2992111 RepID=A0AAE3SK69_9BACT|nr:DUF2089 family protein [Plebeiobacterium marinum]MCW3806480.1 DUF2089 domain-containing protein [Plebeiobacterium marinum]